MQILHLDSGREMRGGQWQALLLHRGLIEDGHASLLLCRHDSPLFTAARERDLPVEPLRPLGLAQQSRGFDLLHAHDAHSHTLCALFARVPFVVSRRVAFPVREGVLSRWKYRRPALFLAVSRYVAAILHQAGIEDSRIVVVYDGVHVPDARGRGEDFLIPYTRDPLKGMSLAQEAAQRAGVAARLTSDFTGDLPTARGLLYISQSEGLGSGILLAMAHGVSVIASDTGGIPELIEDGVNGVLTPNEPAAIAAAFGRIRQPMGDAARLTVMGRFTEAHMVKATLAAYAKAAAHD